MRASPKTTPLSKTRRLQTRGKLISGGSLNIACKYRKLKQSQVLTAVNQNKATEKIGVAHTCKYTLI